MYGADAASTEKKTIKRFLCKAGETGFVWREILRALHCVLIGKEMSNIQFLIVTGPLSADVVQMRNIKKKYEKKKNIQ